jgi:FixJ family two-component response regulator
LAEGRGARTVYVVDDDAPLRRALQRLLQTAGFAVQTFASAEDYLATQHEVLPDCIVLDIRLGRLSGFDLHERLRASGVSIPTIFVTGHDDAVTREQARRVGAAGYVRKPFDDDTLITVIEAALTRR